MGWRFNFVLLITLILRRQFQRKVWNINTIRQSGTLVNGICVSLRIVVSSAHCVCFLGGFCLVFYSMSCVTCVASFYGLSILSYHFSILYRLLTLAHLMLSKCHLVCIISQLWIRVNSIVILCVCVHSGVQHTLCCVFALFYFVLCTIYFSCLQ